MCLVHVEVCVSWVYHVNWRVYCPTDVLPNRRTQITLTLIINQTKTKLPDTFLALVLSRFTSSVYSNPDYYWEKTFPTLYPYGMGGPSGGEFSFKHLSNYHCHVLKCGGARQGRRFQNNSGFIFAAYTYEMKRKVGGMAFAATRDEQVPTGDEEVTTVGNVKALLGSLDRSEPGAAIDLSENFSEYQRIHREQREAKALEESIRRGEEKYWRKHFYK